MDQRADDTGFIVGLERRGQRQLRVRVRANVEGGEAGVTGAVDGHSGGDVGLPELQMLFDPVEVRCSFRVFLAKHFLKHGGVAGDRGRPGCRLAEQGVDVTGLRRVQGARQRAYRGVGPGRGRVDASNHGVQFGAAYVSVGIGYCQQAIDLDHLRGGTKALLEELKLESEQEVAIELLEVDTHWIVVRKMRRLDALYHCPARVSGAGPAEAHGGELQRLQALSWRIDPGKLAGRRSRTVARRPLLAHRR